MTDMTQHACIYKFQIYLCVCVYIYIPFQILFFYRLLQNIDGSYKIGLSWLFILYIECVYLIPTSQFIPHPHLPFSFGDHKFVFYVCESLPVLKINSFVSVFRFHKKAISYDICLWLTSFSMITSKSIHVATKWLQCYSYDIK